MKVKELIDIAFIHHERISIWKKGKILNGRVKVWTGMCWEIPDKYYNATFDKIFGIMPENLKRADSINILITESYK